MGRSILAILVGILGLIGSIVVSGAVVDLSVTPDNIRTAPPPEYMGRKFTPEEVERLHAEAMKEQAEAAKESRIPYRESIRKLMWAAFGIFTMAWMSVACVCVWRWGWRRAKFPLFWAFVPGLILPAVILREGLQNPW